jgi:hypothetical protein
MQNNKLRMAIRATAAVAAFGMAGQALALDVPTGDWDTSIYGFARLNASYDIDEDIATSTQAGDFSKINTGSAEDNEVTGHLGADAKQSRVGIKTVTPEGVKILVEGDFRGSGNSAGSLRLRQAYGEYKGVLAGRTWSNFNSFVGTTPTLDFDGTAGNPGMQDREEQVRYTTGPLSVALEDPRGSLSTVSAPTTQWVIDQDTGTLVQETVGAGVGAAGFKKSLPALTARFQDSNDMMSYAAAAVVRQLSYDTGTADDSAVGFAAFAAATFNITDMISVQGAVNYSDGANTYVWRTGDNYYGTDGYVVNGDIETISSYSATVGTSLSLGNGQSVNVGYGMAKMDWDDAEDDYANNAGQLAAVQAQTETNQKVHVNYMVKPVKNVMLGVEYQYLKTEEVNGDDGDANRLMFAAQYNF